MLNDQIVSTSDRTQFASCWVRIFLSNFSSSLGHVIVLGHALQF